MAPRRSSLSFTPISSFLLSFFALAYLATPVVADGKGLLGLGKWLYKPFCAHACRAVIEDSRVLCEPKFSRAHGVHSSSSLSTLPSEVPHPAEFGHSHEGIQSLQECLLADAAFLRTLALCIGERCPINGVSVPVIEEYWYGHVATGTIGNWVVHPVKSFQDALREARGDVEEAGEGGVPYVRVGGLLNVTSLIKERDWLPEYNAMMYLEKNERDHGRNGLSMALTSIFLPVVLSLLRVFPRRPLWCSQLSAWLERPFIGRRHRTPIVADLGIMPTRGQTLYILYLLAAQVFFCLYPLVYVYPNAIASTRQQHYLLVIGDRTAVVALANLIALCLFSSRNNILLWITHWRHSTFLLFHRWVGYCLIVEVSIHSLLLFILHLSVGDHTKESRRLPWVWGIVGSFAFILLFPTSVLPVRKRIYEAFLAFHQVFAALALVATFLHIYYLYHYAWGYEIWVYVGGGVWFLDRVLRLARVASNGYRRAVVSALDDDGEYLRMEIEGIATEGHVYLYFPTLSWKFWECHPYSVLSCFASRCGGELEGGGAVEVGPGSEDDKAENGSRSTSSRSLRPPHIYPRTALLVKTMDGTTRRLAGCVRSSPGRRLTLGVLVESNYHSNLAARGLSHCSSLLCIAGGVGITTCLPLMRTFGGVRSRLEWGVRSEVLVRELEPELKGLEWRTSVGKRMDIGAIVREELEREGETGDLGIVVCGPNSMADEARNAVAEQGAQRSQGHCVRRRGFQLVAIS